MYVFFVHKISIDLHDVAFFYYGLIRFIERADPLYITYAPYLVY